MDKHTAQEMGSSLGIDLVQNTMTELGIPLQGEDATEEQSKQIMIMQIVLDGIMMISMGMGLPVPLAIKTIRVLLNNVEIGYNAIVSKVTDHSRN